MLHTLSFSTFTSSSSFRRHVLHNAPHTQKKQGAIASIIEKTLIRPPCTPESIPLHHCCHRPITPTTTTEPDTHNMLCRRARGWGEIHRLVPATPTQRTVGGREFNRTPYLTSSIITYPPHLMRHMQHMQHILPPPLNTFSPQTALGSQGGPSRGYQCGCRKRAKVFRPTPSPPAPCAA